MFLKRLIDISLSIIGIILCSPLLLVIALLVKFGSPGPIFYRGIRTGRHNIPFRIFKFRSMVVNAENMGGGTTALADPRITKTGRLIRRLKLDEIPQLFNVFFGDMSFVGPRPELPRYTDQYSEDEKRILNMRPGITDLASIEFASLDEVVGAENADEIYETKVLKRKNQLRLFYVDNWSLLLDLKILIKTIYVIIQKFFKPILHPIKQSN